MAMMTTSGLGELEFDLNELASMPDVVIDGMLMAGGEVIAKGHQTELQSLGLVKTGTLKSGVRIHKKKHTSTSHYVLVYPYGTHHTYNARTGTYTKMNWGRKGGTRTKGGGTKEATNNDVGFVHEFGGHGNAPSQWMRAANEKNIEKAVEAEYKVYDQYLTQKGL